MTVTVPIENIVAWCLCALAIGWTICYMFDDPQPIDWESELEQTCSKTRHFWKLGETYCFCGVEAMREDAEGFVIVKS